MRKSLSGQGSTFIYGIVGKIIALRRCLQPVSLLPNGCVDQWMLSCLSKFFNFMLAITVLLLYDKIYVCVGSVCGFV